MTTQVHSEPMVLTARTQSTTDASSAGAVIDDFDDFYLAHFDGVVAMAFGITADWVEAQDVAQEAFCRAWQHWRQIQRFDNAVAWIRRVTANIALSRWRRIKVARANLWRHLPESTPATSPDRVAVVAALRTLPVDQRHAMLLHYYADFTINDIAHELNVPAGTVKSWLHRSRNQLADMLSEHEPQDQKPEPSTVRTKADRRRTRRTAIATTAAVLAAVMAFLGMRLLAGPASPLPPADPSPSPTSVTETTQVAADDPIRKVDWNRVEITVPANGRRNCTAGKLMFTDGAFGPSSIDPGFDNYSALTFAVDRVALGDLDGDGLAEAALDMKCRYGVDQKFDPRRQLLIVKRSANGDLTGAWWRESTAEPLAGYWIGDGLLHVEGHPRPDRRNGSWVDAYRWSQGTFEPVDVSARFPELSIAGDKANLDLDPVRARFSCTWGDPGDPDTVWSIANYTILGATAIYEQLGRHGDPFLLLPLQCTGPGAITPAFNPHLVLFDRSADGWRAIAVVGPKPSLSGGVPTALIKSYQVSGERLTVQFTSGPPATYQWSGAAWR